MPVSALPDLSSPLAVVCQDAGAANIVFAWLRALAAADAGVARGWRVLAQGAAARLWAERPVALARTCSSVEEVLEGAAGLLTGTSWGGGLEHDARLVARAKGIASDAVVDHWVNYPERFAKNGGTALPDRILVTDEHALLEAQRCFPGVAVQEYANTYLAEAVQAIRPLDAAAQELLYLLGPITAEREGDSRAEFETLNFFAANLPRIVGDARCRLRLRPHPSDPKGKYDEWIARHSALDAQLDAESTLTQAISRARWVAGAETYAMVVALAAGREVISALPPWIHRCRLPQREIVHLRDRVPVELRPTA